jgi:hypothetical protein
MPDFNKPEDVLNEPIKKFIKRFQYLKVKQGIGETIDGH